MLFSGVIIKSLGDQERLEDLETIDLAQSCVIQGYLFYVISPYNHQQNYRLDQIRNEDIRNELGISPLSEKVIKYRNKWKAHLQRMERTRIPL
jgi:hypothetical protein